MKLYDSRLSGNGWKVRLLLSHLGLSFQREIIVPSNGETRTVDFKRKNVIGRLPVLELEDGRTLAESNAILIYLSEGTPFLPADRFDRASVFQWLFFEQNEHNANMSVPRKYFQITKNSTEKADEIAFHHRLGSAALKTMDEHLSSHDFFACGRYSIADISLFPYTSMAAEGGYQLRQFPHVEAWLDRVKSQPGYIRLVID